MFHAIVYAFKVLYLLSRWCNRPTVCYWVLCRLQVQEDLDRSLLSFLQKKIDSVNSAGVKTHDVEYTHAQCMFAQMIFFLWMSTLWVPGISHRTSIDLHW